MFGGTDYVDISSVSRAYSWGYLKTLIFLWLVFQDKYGHFCIFKDFDRYSQKPDCTFS